MLIACATDDKVNLINDHFGDAKYFNIYKLEKEKYELVESVDNNTTSDRHADPNKAKQILQLLNSKGVQILMNKAFGPNIKIVNRFLLPVVIRENTILNAINQIQNSFYKIKETIDNKKDCYLLITNEGKVKIIETA